MQRPLPLTLRGKSIGLLRHRESLLGEYLSDGIDTRINLLDACEIGFDHLAARNRFVSDGLSQIRGAGTPEFTCNHRTTPSLFMFATFTMMLLFGWSNIKSWTLVKETIGAKHKPGI